MTLPTGGPTSALARRCEDLSGAFSKAQAGPGATVRLSDTTTLLRNLANGASICLIGSIHTLQDSAEEVLSIQTLV